MKQYFLILYCITVFQLHAQKPSQNIVGLNIEIDSEFLEEKRQIQVFLPDSYKDSDKAYPVLYLLDGQRFFLYSVSLLESFQQYNLTPEFIIVGITTGYPKRFSDFSGGRSKFISFLESELLTHIDKNYRTTDKRMIFGWEYAGSLALHAMVNDQLFDGYFIASPFPVWGSIDQLDSISNLSGTLYFTVSPNEYEVNFGVNKLDSVLSEKDYKELNWEFLTLQNEEHRSTAYSTLYHSLRKYFKYYPQLSINDLEDFLAIGGIAYALNYNQIRADQYGFEQELSTWSKFTMIRSAMRADQYEQFDSFCTELNLKDFIDNLSANRVMSIADFYVKYQEFEKAVNLYLNFLEQHPDSENLLTKTGEVYQAWGKKKEAKKYLQLAKEAQQ